MPACPKCGYPQATVLNCPKCKATFAKPLSISEEPKAPVSSPALGKEILIDRRSAPRGPSAQAPEAAKPRAAADESWLFEPGESTPAPKPRPSSPPRAVTPPPTRAAPVPVAPPPAAPAPAAAPAASASADAGEAGKKRITNKFGWPGVEPRPGSPVAPAPAAPAPVPAAPAPSHALPVSPSVHEAITAPPAPAAPPERHDEMMSAGQVHEIAPEPKFEKAALPQVDAPSEPPLSHAGLPHPADAKPEPGPSSKPSSIAAEAAQISGPPARSMAVRSAEIPIESIRAEPGGALAQIGAGLVDAALIGALFAAWFGVAQLIAGRVPTSDETGIDWLIERTGTWRGVLLPGGVFFAALWFVYGALFHSLGGRTLGKRLFGLTVVDSTGQPPRLARSAARSLLSLLSAALLMMGFVLVLFDARRQALHDKLTGTFVVHLLD